MIANAESLTEYFDRDSLKGDPLTLVNLPLRKSLKGKGGWLAGI